ncbi:asparagine synthase [Pseudalkalibacillus caeni]|uniref:Asparagine synthase n=1 Tax=Exobacillus caeni TaxID=2574798 RepID=A0A5R9F6D1_9BACL|nr:asparagine synthase [Pseudalkalibacillus caeni]TLS37906.1 asparagine synthase [Pseudalkalibacillus caeni]
MNNVREGVIPTVLGTAVTAAGYALRNNHRINQDISNGIVGFGLAHVVLGAIDLYEHRR